MHVAQIILIEADSTEDALSEVASILSGSETNTPEWSDWHNATYGSDTFAGRYEGLYFGKENENDVLRYSDDPELARKVIADFLEYRVVEIQRLRSELQKNDFDLLEYNYDPEPEQVDFSELTNLWPIKKLASIYNDDWSPDSYVYDLVEYDASLRHFNKRVAEKPDQQFLVVVDFHF